MNQLKTYIRKHFLPETLPKASERGSWLSLPLIAFLLLVYEYFGWQMPFMRLSLQVSWLSNFPPNSLKYIAQAYTSTSFVILFVLIPLIFSRLFPVDGPNPFSFRLELFKQFIPSYLPLIVLMTPVLWVAAGRPDFNRFYPLYEPETLHHLLAYETIYMVQFVAIEYFFRGFMLFRMERAAPGYGVWVMLIPYALVHIHKPFPEAVASIFAGIVLGFLALKSRSIWPGVLVHCYVALSTDLFSLIRSGRFSVLF
ncbi:MAG: CPBP family intramembrane metalloprotease [Bdellovibrionales bacterium]|nr:CPBP family intramembrane metalloprotease [Bdellovibrionales bacterium]